MPDRAPSPSACTRDTPAWRRWPLRVFLLAWGLLLAVPPVALLRVRETWLEELGGQAVQENWETFRREMGEQTGVSGPVQRKVPRSVEPPLRVWLRDYVGLAITAWLVLGGTLGAFLGVMVAGATTPLGASGSAQPSEGDHSPKTTPAVAATATKSTRAIPSTPRSENTEQDLPEDGG